MADAIEMVGITKTFPGVVANDNVSISVKENEVLALLGENGAGKSTLMSILFGAYNPDQGIIKIRGKQVQIKDHNAATALGIGMVHQHFKLIHNYTVAENIILGIEPVNKFGMLDLKTAREKVKTLSETYGLNVNPDAKIEDITVGMQQRVEILKVLYRNADIIIFDEPTPADNSEIFFARADNCFNLSCNAICWLFNFSFWAERVFNNLSSSFFSLAYFFALLSNFSFSIIRSS